MTWFQVVLLFVFPISVAAVTGVGRLYKLYRSRRRDSGSKIQMSENLKGVYKREPKADRPTHIYVETQAGERYPVTIAEYEAMKVAPHWGQVPWESDFKKHAADGADEAST